MNNQIGLFNDRIFKVRHIIGFVYAFRAILSLRRS